MLNFKKEASPATTKLSFDDLAKEELTIVDLDSLRGAKGTCHDEDDEILRKAGWLDQF